MQQRFERYPGPSAPAQRAQEVRLRVMAEAGHHGRRGGVQISSIDHEARLGPAGELEHGTRRGKRAFDVLGVCGAPASWCGRSARGAGRAQLDPQCHIGPELSAESTGRVDQPGSQVGGLNGLCRCERHGLTADALFALGRAPSPRRPASADEGCGGRARQAVGQSVPRRPDEALG
jgi:hypothetical protein